MRAGRIASVAYALKSQNEHIFVLKWGNL